jgi:hypothetical protein
VLHKTQPVQLGAEPVRKGEAELAQLLVREAPLHAALVHLPVEHDIGNPAVYFSLVRARCESDVAVGAELVNLREFEEGIAHLISTEAENPVDHDEPVLRIREHEKELGAPCFALRPGWEGLKAEGHVGTKVEQEFPGVLISPPGQFGLEGIDRILASKRHGEKIGGDRLYLSCHLVDSSEKIGTERQLHVEASAQFQEHLPDNRGPQLV